MIRFLLKGIVRDRSRSLFPFLTVTAGVMLTVFLYCYIKGAESNFVESSAKFSTGHVKIMSQAYAAEADQFPNDLAYIGVEALLAELRQDFPEMNWTPRIRFAGLLDIPDEAGETRSQGPVAGLAIDLFGSDSPELPLLKIEKAVVSGHLPRQRGEILVTADLAAALGIKPGDTATLISSTMYGAMAMTNFTVAGTIRFGVTAMDRGAVLADIRDIQQALDMSDAAGEILGFFKDFIYRDKDAVALVRRFNARHEKEEDEFRPVMVTLKNQSGLADLLAMIENFSAVVILVFVAAMSIVLWNAGLMGSLRRYGEIGVRLAMGEGKGHLYRSLIAESMIIAFFGSIVGTAVGVAIAYYIQVHGIDVSSFMKGSSLMMTDYIRARVTPTSFVIGFLPGLGATFIGTSISGIGIYRRKTSALMKELEA